MSLQSVRRPGRPDISGAPPQRPDRVRTRSVVTKRLYGDFVGATVLTRSLGDAQREHSRPADRPRRRGAFNEADPRPRPWLKVGPRLGPAFTGKSLNLNCSERGPNPTRLSARRKLERAECQLKAECPPGPALQGGGRVESRPWLLVWWPGASPPEKKKSAGGRPHALQSVRGKPVGLNSSQLLVALLGILYAEV
jgi:hypothetical protein